MMMKGSIYQEYIAILNMYAPKNRILKYMKQKLIGLIEEICKSKIIVREMSTPSSQQLIGQKIQENHQDIKDLSDTNNQSTGSN